MERILQSVGSHHRVNGRKMIDIESFLKLYKYSFPREGEKWDDLVPDETLNNEEFQKKKKKKNYLKITISVGNVLVGHHIQKQENKKQWPTWRQMQL